jgi:hypothetical protein
MTEEETLSGSSDDLYTSRLRDELLQLSLVHRDSTRTMQAFENSVVQQLQNSSVKVRKEAEAVAALEAAFRERVNALAICHWLDNQDTNASERRVEDLSFCINEIAEISKPTSEYSLCLSEFDRWLAKVQNAMKAPHEADSETQHFDSLLLIDSIGLGWSKGVRTQMERLELCQQLLQNLGEPPQNSSLAPVLSKHQQLARVKLEKLVVAQNIVGVVSDHQRRLKHQALRTATDEVVRGSHHSSRNGLWSSRDICR